MSTILGPEGVFFAILSLERRRGAADRPVPPAIENSIEVVRGACMYSVTLVDSGS
jgi:hypothetical protein